MLPDGKFSSCKLATLQGLTTVWDLFERQVPIKDGEDWWKNGGCALLPLTRRKERGPVRWWAAQSWPLFQELSWNGLCTKTQFQEELRTTWKDELALLSETGSFLRSPDLQSGQSMVRCLATPFCQTDWPLTSRWGRGIVLGSSHWCWHCTCNSGEKACHHIPLS